MPRIQDPDYPHVSVMAAEQIAAVVRELSPMMPNVEMVPAGSGDAEPVHVHLGASSAASFEEHLVGGSPIALAQLVGGVTTILARRARGRRGPGSVRLADVGVIGAKRGGDHVYCRATFFVVHAPEQSS